MSDDDRRRQNRLPAEVKIDYRTVGSFISDYSKNISQGGLFVGTSLPLEVGARVRLRVTLPAGDLPFALDGVVRWVSTLRDRDKHPPGMGIQFVNFDDSVRAQLERLFQSVSDQDQDQVQVHVERRTQGEHEDGDPQQDGGRSRGPDQDPDRGPKDP